MRGADVQQPGMFSYVSLEERVPAEHPIRMLRRLVDVILGELDGVFAECYARRWSSVDPAGTAAASFVVAGGVQRAQ